MVPETNGDWSGKKALEPRPGGDRELVGDENDEIPLEVEVRLRARLERELHSGGSMPRAEIESRLWRGRKAVETSPAL
jgi:hypothetical protein